MPMFSSPCASIAAEQLTSTVGTSTASRAICCARSMPNVLLSCDELDGPLDELRRILPDCTNAGDVSSSRLNGLMPDWAYATA